MPINGFNQQIANRNVLELFLCTKVLRNINVQNENAVTNGYFCN